MRPRRGQSASCHHCSVAASASPPLPSHSVAARRLSVAARALLLSTIDAQGSRLEHVTWWLHPQLSPRLYSSSSSSCPPRLGLRRDLVSSRWPRTLPDASKGGQQLLFKCPPPAPVRLRRVQHPTLSVSCVCRGDRLVPHSAEAADVSAPSRAGQTLSNGGPEGLPHLTRPAPAPKPPVPPAGQLVHRDAVGSEPSAGQRQATAPTAPLRFF